MALNSRDPVAGFSIENCVAMVALLAPLWRPRVIVPVWKHCRYTQRSVWSSLSKPSIVRTSVPRSGGSKVTIPVPVVMTPPLKASFMFVLVICDMANCTDESRPVVTTWRWSSSSATSTGDVDGL
jgi:hypothetical protein